MSTVNYLLLRSKVILEQDLSAAATDTYFSASYNEDFSAFYLPSQHERTSALNLGERALHVARPVAKISEFALNKSYHN